MGVEIWLRLWERNKLTPPLKAAGQGQRNDYGSIDKKTRTKRNQTHTQRRHYLETYDKAVEGLIFRQGDTHGCSWSECLGDVKNRLSTPGASLALLPCLSVCLSVNFPFQSPNIPTAQKPRECLTMPWKSFNQTCNILSPKGMGCGVWEKKG